MRGLVSLNTTNTTHNILLLSDGRHGKNLMGEAIKYENFFFNRDLGILVKNRLENILSQDQVKNTRNCLLQNNTMTLLGLRVMLMDLKY